VQNVRRISCRIQHAQERTRQTVTQQCVAALYRLAKARESVVELAAHALMCCALPCEQERDARRGQPHCDRLGL